MAVFLDSEYLSRLTTGSFESTVVGLAEAVAQKPDVFGEGAETIATFGSHAIVLNPATGRSWRVRHESDAAGVATIVGVEPANIPVQHDRDLARSAKAAADAVVDAMLAGKDQETVDLAGGLLRLAQEGASLTMRAVEDQVRAFAGSDFPWREELEASRDNLMGYVSGVEEGDVPQPKFAEIVGASDGDGRLLLAVEDGMHRLVDFYAGLMERLDRVMDADVDWSDSDAGAAGIDEFAAGVAEDLAEMAGYAEDAAAAADTDPGASARVHDILASFAEDVNLAVAFVEKVVEDVKEKGGEDGTP